SHLVPYTTLFRSPIEKVIESANRSKRNPLHLAINSVLSPIKRNVPKTISAAVVIIPSVRIKESGNQGLITRVYSKKLFQFPQTDIFSSHHPNLSATADKKVVPIASRRKSLIIFFVMFVVLF